MAVLPDSQLQEVRRLFRSYLKERGQRQTPERFAILEEVYASPGHFDADELYLRMKQAGSRVSRATVYNTLELLMGCDLVVKHQFGKSQAKFERAFAFWQHDHLICLDCGKILEFCDPRLQSIQDTVQEIFGFEIVQHALHMYGRCQREDCPDRPVQEQLN
jgi:Fur family transcriptional regulator, ferric uptake regulator